MSSTAISWARPISVVDPRAKLLLLLLADHADEVGSCDADHNRLSIEACMTASADVSALQKLEAAGLIRKGTRNRADLLSRPRDRYYLNITLSSPVPPAAAFNEGEGNDRKNRGTRLQANWQPSAEDIAYARRQGLDDDAINREAEIFRNHWIAKSGRDAAKRDWHATWRNWCRRAIEFGDVI